MDRLRDVLAVGSAEVTALNLQCSPIGLESYGVGSL